MSTNALVSNEGNHAVVTTNMCANRMAWQQNTGACCRGGA